MLAELLHGEVVDDCSVCLLAVAQVAPGADLVDEPRDLGAVSMLSALSPREAEHYRTEANAINWTNKPLDMFWEISEQYVFIGGPLSVVISKPNAGGTRSPWCVVLDWLSPGHHVFPLSEFWWNCAMRIPMQMLLVKSLVIPPRGSPGKFPV